MKKLYLEKVKQSFHSCCEWVFKSIPADAIATMTLDAESTLFVRCNNHRVRQNSNIEQGRCQLLLNWKKKSYKFIFSTSGNADEDLKKIKVMLLKSLSEWDQLLSENLDFRAVSHQSSANFFWSEYDPVVILDHVLKVTSSIDFTGLITIGPVLNCVRNSLGVHHEFLTELVSIDYSLYEGPLAVKGLYSVRIWNPDDFSESLLQSKHLLQSMKKNKIAVVPNSYRVYLAPGAVSELAQMLNWGAVSQKSYKLGRNPMKRLIENEISLSSHLSIAEDFELGLGPQFNSLGEISPTHLSVIQHGKIENLFTSTKSSIEFGVESNLADEDEGFRSMSIAPGTLEREKILSELDTGLYISNLHYLNWSNPMEARITGMTRYACLWVENGQIQGPIADLRFDDTLFDLWGENLESVTNFTELEPQTMTYFQRHLGGKKIPGMLIKKMKFTL